MKLPIQNGFIARAGCQSEEPLTAYPGYEGINYGSFAKKMWNLIAISN
jgi:hypothetical protein